LIPEHLLLYAADRLLIAQEGCNSFDPHTPAGLAPAE
jgi:hypothetical protein